MFKIVCILVTISMDPPHCSTQPAVMCAGVRRDPRTCAFCVYVRTRNDCVWLARAGKEGIFLCPTRALTRRILPHMTLLPNFFLVRAVRTHVVYAFSLLCSRRAVVTQVRPPFSFFYFSLSP